MNEVLERVLRRDRLAVAVALLVVILSSWIYVLVGAGMGMSAWDMTVRPSFLQSENSMEGMQGGTEAMNSGDAGMSDDPSMTSMGAMSAMSLQPWTPGYAVLMFFMWWIMMIAMMLPSAAPMILLYARINRREKDRGRPFVPTGFFAGGYLLAWAGFSLGAVLLHWGLESVALVSAMMSSTSVYLAATLLVLAGLYQITPIKQACLKHCRSPVLYLAERWRKGNDGALLMGLEHGAFCLGCCWVLMLLLFVGGVMNLYWIIGLAVFVLVEKCLPVGRAAGYVLGGILVVAGIAVLAV